MEPVFFSGTAELREWLTANASTAREAWVGLYKRGSGRPSITWKIEDVLESIRPALRSDGGDVEFIDFDEDDGIVQVRLARSLSRLSR